jgi:hypothetical protein
LFIGVIIGVVIFVRIVYGAGGDCGVATLSTLRNVAIGVGRVARVAQRRGAVTSLCRSIAARSRLSLALLLALGLVAIRVGCGG